jgi:hypothetical protein
MIWTRVLKHAKKVSEVTELDIPDNQYADTTDDLLQYMDADERRSYAAQDRSEYRSRETEHAHNHNKANERANIQTPAALKRRPQIIDPVEGDDENSEGLSRDGLPPLRPDQRINTGDQNRLHGGGGEQRELGQGDESAMRSSNKDDASPNDDGAEELPVVGNPTPPTIAPNTFIGLYAKS